MMLNKPDLEFSMKLYFGADCPDPVATHVSCRRVEAPVCNVSVPEWTRMWSSRMAGEEVPRAPGSSPLFRRSATPGHWPPLVTGHPWPLTTPGPRHPWLLAVATRLIFKGDFDKYGT